MPACLLRDVDPIEVKEIRVSNCINEDEYWYYISFFGKNGVK